MNTISQIDRILRSVRAQVAPQRGLPEPGEKTEAKLTLNNPRRPNVAVYVADRIASIAKDDPQRQRRAFRAFLEGCLLDLFDESAVGDVAFQALIDKAQDAMGGDESLSGTVERVGAVLLAQADDGSLSASLTRVLSLRDPL